MTDAINSFVMMDVKSILAFTLLFAVVLTLLPRMLKKLGVTKIGPVEMEQQNQTLNYEVARQIEEIDINNREDIWDMTEELFGDVAMASTIPCQAAIGNIIGGIASPIRTMVMLNHIAPKLGKSHESALRAKINRGITRSLRENKGSALPHECPVYGDVSQLSPDKYADLITAWIEAARAIAAKACKKKIDLYINTLEGITDDHWRKVYKTCIDKNEAYIEDMGFIIDRTGEVIHATEPTRR